MINEVLSFSREYLNDKKQRTLDRKQKIRTIYKKLTGEDINGRCSTCYVEALLKILKLTEPIIPKEMATQNYQLKPGVLLQEFGYPDKTCTNQTLTDELAKWHLERCPGKTIMFARIPDVKQSIITIVTPIVQPEIKQEPIPEVNTNLIAEVLNYASGAEPLKPKKEVKKKPAKGKK